MTFFDKTAAIWHWQRLIAGRMEDSQIYQSNALNGAGAVYKEDDPFRSPQFCQEVHKISYYMTCRGRSATGRGGGSGK